jgi:hypothetical protein
MKYDGVIYRAPKKTCQGCTKRYVGCHAKCEEYINALAEWKADRKEAKAFLFNDREFERHQNEQIYREIRRHK